MTRDQLIKRASMLEEILDNSDEISLPEVEEELCSIYKLLREMQQ